MLGIESEKSLTQRLKQIGINRTPAKFRAKEKQLDPIFKINELPHVSVSATPLKLSNNSTIYKSSCLLSKNNKLTIDKITKLKARPFIPLPPA